MRTRSVPPSRPRVVPRALKPMEAETRLLELAAQISGLPPVGAVEAALRALVAAYAPSAPLPRALARGWLASQGNKTALLALSWARERLRLALEEVLLHRATTPGALPGSPETRSRLILAACEAVALEPPSAVADRLRTLLELNGCPIDPA